MSSTSRPVWSITSARPSNSHALELVSPPCSPLQGSIPIGDEPFLPMSKPTRSLSVKLKTPRNGSMTSHFISFSGVYWLNCVSSALPYLVSAAYHELKAVPKYSLPACSASVPRASGTPSPHRGSSGEARARGKSPAERIGSENTLSALDCIAVEEEVSKKWWDWGLSSSLESVYILLPRILALVVDPWTFRREAPIHRECPIICRL